MDHFHRRLQLIHDVHAAPRTGSGVEQFANPERITSRCQINGHLPCLCTLYRFATNALPGRQIIEPDLIRTVNPTCPLECRPRDRVVADWTSHCQRVVDEKISGGLQKVRPLSGSRRPTHAR